MKIEIKNRYSEAIIYSGEADTLKDLLVVAAKVKANLGGADLGGANLREANLREANLGGADLGDNVVIQLGPLGSRKGYLVCIASKGKTEYRAGCFVGTEKQLREKIK